MAMCKAREPLKVFSLRRYQRCCDAVGSESRLVWMFGGTLLIVVGGPCLDRRPFPENRPPRLVLNLKLTNVCSRSLRKACPDLCSLLPLRRASATIRFSFEPQTVSQGL